MSRTAVDPASLSPRVESELQVLLGREPGRYNVERLTHNTRNAVTAGIWRITAGDWSAILKEVQHKDTDDPQWASSDVPDHWNYWRREALAYQHDIGSMYAPDGVRAPRLLRLFERDPKTVALWLEDVTGPPAEQWGVEGLAAFARRLGAAQGRFVDRRPDLPWLSRDFLRSYVESKRVDYDLLEDDAAWEQPMVRDHCPPETRAAALALHRRRDVLLSIMDSLPRSLCHLDVWPKNMLADRSGDMVLVDWAFVGEGALGEDLGNLIPDCIFDLLYGSTLLPSLDSQLFDAYVAGLRSVGWDGDVRLVRLGLCASAVKYAWLAPLMLARASAEEHLDYGGARPVSGPQRYAERGITIVHLGRWVDEALDLAVQLYARRRGAPTSD